jgi:hypothetical protein
MPEVEVMAPSVLFLVSVAADVFTLEKGIFNPPLRFYSPGWSIGVVSYEL